MKEHAIKMLGENSEAAKLAYGENKEQDEAEAKARRQRIKQRYKLATLSV